MTKFRNLLTGEVFSGHETTDNPASSYGRPVWVRDDNGEAFDLVGLEEIKGGIKMYWELVQAIRAAKKEAERATSQGEPGFKCDVCGDIVPFRGLVKRTSDGRMLCSSCERTEIVARGIRDGVCHVCGKKLPDDKVVVPGKCPECFNAHKKRGLTCSICGEPIDHGPALFDFYYIHEGKPVCVICIYHILGSANELLALETLNREGLAAAIDVIMSPELDDDNDIIRLREYLKKELQGILGDLYYEGHLPGE